MATGTLPPPAVASFDHWVPVPFSPNGLFNFSFLFQSPITGQDLAKVNSNGAIVRKLDPIGDNIGRGRGIIYLPGSNSPFFPTRVAAMEWVSAGYTFFGATLPFEPGDFNGLCNRQRYAEAIVDFIEDHPIYSNLEELSALGHSIGGQVWYTRMSDFQACPGKAKEVRVQAAAVLDATWEATSIDQTSNLNADVARFYRPVDCPKCLLNWKYPPPRKGRP